ncbi:MAG: gamma-glutamylcyclotransferase [Burkholderiales bacterium]|nr:gamma-glutamylcyclotransferase [Burkholderiales bacterium]
MKRHIFTYGSLMFAEVWRRVVASSYRSAKGKILDHARYAVMHETYPGLVVQKGASVEGIVYFDVQAADIAALDNFEGPDYFRRTVTVQLQNAQIEADTYIYGKQPGLSDMPWDPQAFEIERFLQTYCRVPKGAANDGPNGP